MGIGSKSLMTPPYTSARSDDLCRHTPSRASATGPRDWRTLLPPPPTSLHLISLFSDLLNPPPPPLLPPRTRRPLRPPTTDLRRVRDVQGRRVPDPGYAAEREREHCYILDKFLEVVVGEGGGGRGEGTREGEEEGSGEGVG